MSTAITRRNALAAIATLPAMAGATVATAAPDDTSCIAGLIEAHKAAQAAFSAAVGRQMEIEGAYQEARWGDKSWKEVVLPLSIGGAVSVRLGIFAKQDSAFENAAENVNHMYDGYLSQPQINRLKRVFPGSDHVKAIRTSVRKLKAKDVRALQRLLEVERDQQVAFGVAGATEVADTADEAEQQAFWSVLTYRCLNRAEIGMKAQYLTEAYDRRGVAVDEQEYNALLWSMLPDNDERVTDDQEQQAT